MRDGWGRMDSADDKTDKGNEASGDRALNAVVAFSERLAHDANNYIGAILGLSEVLPAVADDPEQVSLIAAKIAVAGRLLQIVVNQPSLAYTPPLSPPRLDTGEALGAARMFVENLAPRRITVEVRQCAGDMVFGISRREFSSVLFILLCNALDAIGEAAGRIDIVMDEISATDALRDGARVYWRGVLAEGRYLALSVTDSAAGLPAGDVSHLFQPLYSATRRKTALGLGLGFASAILESRGGAMAVSRDPRTEFTAFIPAAVEVDEVLADLPEEARIIIVDPLMQWGNAATTLLNAFGRAATCAATVDIAADLLDAAPPFRHVVVLYAARRGISNDGLIRLRDLLAQRLNIDLLIVAGAISVAPDAAALLGDMASVQLGSEAEPADLVNYLIPNM